MIRSALIIGLGQFGLTLVEELSKKGWELIVIDNNQEKAQQIKDLAHQIIITDAVNKEILKKFATQVEMTVVCSGEKIDSSILITYYLKELGVKKILAKASSKEHGEILKAVGADEILFPERETAQRLALSLTSPDIMEIIKLSNNFDIVEASAPDSFIGKTIKELSLRNKYQMDVLAIKNALTGNLIIMPPAEHKFNPDDIMVVIGGVESIEKLNLK
ncbi:MAG: TrkA family potassium uptake protein [Candidatus Omnitrophota bacterium]